jgi:hypothetical protein
MDTFETVPSFPGAKRRSSASASAGLGVCYKRYALALRLPPAFITGLEFRDSSLFIGFPFFYVARLRVKDYAYFYYTSAAPLVWKRVALLLYLF